jgi:hypothetical protein
MSYSSIVQGKLGQQKLFTKNEQATVYLMMLPVV